MTRFKKSAHSYGSDQQAEEAARFYVSIFPNSAVRGIARIPTQGRVRKASVMTVAFEFGMEQWSRR